MSKDKHATFWNSFEETAERHRVSGASIVKAKAEAILRLIDNCEQAELNRLALQYRLATPDSDAATVNKRMRDLAEGVLQQYAVGRFVDEAQQPILTEGRPSGPSM